MYKCINCIYEGDKIIDELFCPVCGDYIEGKKPDISPDEALGRTDLPKEEVKLDFDINEDGKVDHVDDSLIAKRLGSKGGRSRKKKK